MTTARTRFENLAFPHLLGLRVADLRQRDKTWQPCYQRYGFPLERLTMRMSRRWLIVWSLILASCGGGGGSDTTITPPPITPPPPTAATYTVDRVFTQLSFSQPVLALQRSGDDTLWYVVERAGVIRRFTNDANVATSDLVLDLSSVVDSGPSEAGLLGMAFDPDFSTNGFVYLSYTVPGTPLISRIDRFSSTDGGLTIDPASGTNLLSVSQNQGNHNGGHIAFGPDGFLYAGFGDGGGGGDPADNGQTSTNLLGTLIRIDVSSASYAIPADNPFAGSPLCDTGSGAQTCPEIFAYGLRNPWRFSFDRSTGDLFVGDVGQNELEEIDRVAIGDNLGWNTREGNVCYNATTCTTAGLVDPIHVYERDVGTSVTGGYVYRGSANTALVGRYVFGDFASGRIWTIDPAAQSLTSSDELINTSLSIASFAESNAGDLLVIDYSGGLYQLNEN